MEPLTIIGLVCNVMQCISFGNELLTSARELSGGGYLQEAEQLKLLVHDVRKSSREILQFLSEGNLSDQLRREIKRMRHFKVGSFLQDELEPLKKIANECDKITEEILGQLERLELKHSGWQRKLEVFKVSGRALWNRKELRELKTRLLELEGRLASWWTGTMIRHHGQELEDVQDKTHLVLASIESLGHRLDSFQGNGRRLDTARLDELKTTLDLSFNSIEAQINRHFAETKGQVQELVKQQDDTDNHSTNAYNSQHDSILKDAISSVQDFMNEWHKITKAIEILHSLAFDTIHHRRDYIDQAHEETCIWVYDSGRTNFAEWLKSGSGIYWISGLAGSGKSTLMKFVAADENTHRSLQDWAGGCRLIIASHYFWNAGTDMQKSHQGLLQTLLYQIIEADLTLCDVLCPGRHMGTPWSMRELTMAFERLSTMSESKVMFCFFIDGLDEYQGPEETLVQLVKTISSAPNVKICASSRPWPAFYAEWNSSMFTLKMQDFTRDDMVKYVKENLESSEKFRTTAAQESKCGDLIENISNKANGVWLWVYLVVRDILRDIRDGEPFQQWQNRLDSSPQELIPYFRKMMERADPFHRRQGAEIFLLALAATYSNISMLGLPLLCEENTPQYATFGHSYLLTEEELEQMYVAWQPRLQNRCTDLMRLSRNKSRLNLCEQYEVIFLHRTVKDFLEEHYAKELRALVSPEFSELACLARLTFMLIEQVQLSRMSMPDDSLGSLINRLFRYLCDTAEAEEAQQQPPYHFELVDAFDKTMERLLTDSGWAGAGKHHMSWLQLVSDKDDIDFVHLTVQLRLRRYSLHRLQTRRDWSRTQAVMYMRCALLPTLTHVIFNGTPSLDPKLVAGLVDLGIDPNISLNANETAWTCFLQQCAESWVDWSATQRAEALDAIRVFIRSGARTDALVQDRRVPDLLTSLIGQAAMADLENLVAGGRVGYRTWVGRLLASPFGGFRYAGNEN